MDRINALIKGLEKRAEQARQVRDVLADDPVLAERVVRIIVGSGNGTASKPLGRVRGQREGRTVVSRVYAFFKERGNPWVTVDQVAEALGITPGSVRAVIYSTHGKAAFAGRKHPQRPKAKQWQLKDIDGG